MIPTMQSGLRIYILNLTLLLLVFFTIMSINGAFIGTQRAKVFFNSPPMIVFWCILLVFLLAGFFIYPSLRKRPGLLLIHLGCCLVLIGAMADSALVHKWINGELAMKQGFMTLRPGQASPMMFDEKMTRHVRLPFTVGLLDTWVTFYDDNPNGMVKDYHSTLRIMQDGLDVKEKTIEVNKPLFYRGYYFYQYKFGADQFSTYSEFNVVSTAGFLMRIPFMDKHIFVSSIWLVFGGYGFIFAGLAWHFWLGLLRRPVRGAYDS